MPMFTSKVREYRQARNLTQEELAERVCARRETIVRLESAKYNPSLELAARIAFELDTSIDELFEFHFAEQRAAESAALRQFHENIRAQRT